ncbi:MAG: cupin domain-containing protein [Xanthomonadales bacterium]|nr:cupin domain-containing protein [Xanthomonadales bacterium]
MSAEHALPHALGRDEAEHYRWGEGCDGWHLRQGADLSVIEERVPAGVGECAHRHHRAEQVFYLLEGAAVMEFETHDVALAAGQSVQVPAGVAHRFVNRSAAAVRFLVISAPTTRGDREDLPTWRADD